MSAEQPEAPSSGVRIMHGRRGHPTALVMGEDGIETCLHSLYDPIREAGSFVAGPVDAAVLVFLGTGLGYHLPRSLANNPHVNRVILVERHPELAELAAARLCQGWNGRIEVVTPSTPGSGFPPVPGALDAAALYVVPHPPSLRAHPAWYDHYRILLATVGRTGPAADRTQAAGRPLTILVPFEAYYVQQECIHGLESLGHRVVVLDCRGREGDEASLFGEALRGERPDLVLSVNMRGLDRRGVAAQMLRRLGIPLALWFVDSPEFILYGEALPPADGCHVFLWEKSYLPAVAAQGYRVSYLPLAADVRLAGAARVEERFSAGLSFVGNSLASGFLARLAVKFPVTAQVMAFAGEAVERIIAARGDQLQLVDQLVAEGGRFLPDDDARLFFRAYLLHSATSAYRTRLLGQLLPLGLTFFGDPDGWRKVFGSAIDARPDVNYFRETPAVYASSAVNVNATSLQMPHTVNQRVFDVPLCGGFLLTDRQGALGELFAENEVALYDGISDVAETARCYLEREGLRREIAERARRRVLGEHTYGHRMRKMIAEVLGAAARPA